MENGRSFGRCLLIARCVAMATPLSAFPTASAAQVNVLISGGFSTAYRQVLPEFERTTGIAVVTGSGASQGSGPQTIAAQLQRGVPADVVILSREGLAELVTSGRIVAGTDVDLARAPRSRTSAPSRRSARRCSVRKASRFPAAPAAFTSRRNCSRSSESRIGSPSRSRNAAHNRPRWLPPAKRTSSSNRSAS